MRFIYSMSIEGRKIQGTSKFIKVEHNKLNPITKSDFVSIAYYETTDFEIVGLIF